MKTASYTWCIGHQGSHVEIPFLRILASLAQIVSSFWCFTFRFPFSLSFLLSDVLKLQVFGWPLLTWRTAWWAVPVWLLGSLRQAPPLSIRSAALLAVHTNMSQAAVGVWSSRVAVEAKVTWQMKMIVWTTTAKMDCMSSALRHYIMFRWRQRDTPETHLWSSESAFNSCLLLQVWPD